jgi:hypothetical protein
LILKRMDSMACPKNTFHFLGFAAALLVAGLPQTAEAGLVSGLGKAFGKLLGRKGAAVTTKVASKRAAKSVARRITPYVDDAAPRGPILIADKYGRITGQLADPAPKLAKVKAGGAKVAGTVRAGGDLATNWTKVATGVGAGSAAAGGGAAAISRWGGGDDKDNEPSDRDSTPEPENDSPLGQSHP